MFRVRGKGFWMLWGVSMIFSVSVAMAENPPAEPRAPGEEDGVVQMEAPAATEEKLPEIEVLAHAEKAATSSIITKEDVSLAPYQNLPGYLEEQTGIDMTRRSLLSAKGRQMVMRGFDESRYQIYLNGRTWKGAGVKGGFYVDWTAITPADLERLEIIRGPLSAEYGNTLGGVVTIRTQRGSAAPKLYLDTYWGNWRTQNYRLLHTGGYGPVQYSLGANVGKTDGYLRNNFVDDRGNFEGSLTYTFPWELSLTGAARYHTQKTGMIVYNQPDCRFYNADKPDSDGDALYGPGINFIGGANGGPFGLTYGDRSNVRSQRYELDMEARQPFLSGAAEAHLFYFQAVREDKFYALNNPNRLIAKRGSWDEDTWGWNLKIRQNPSFGRFGFGLEGNYFGYGPLTYNYLDPAYVRTPFPTNGLPVWNAQKLHGGFVDAAIPFWKNIFELYLGLRYDNYDAAAQPQNNVRGLRADAVSPKCTLTIRPTDTTEGYLSVNYSTRFPTLPEYYWFNAGYQPPQRSGNISPEFGMQYEAGITQELPWRSRLKVRTYYYDINDYIRSVFGYRPSRVIYNLDLAKFRGIEVEGEIGLPYHLIAYANYTWQQISTSPDPLFADMRKLPELPEHKAHIGLKYKAPNGAEGRAYVRLVSKRSQFTVTANARNQITGVQLRPMKGFFTFNLEGRYPVMEYHGFKGFLYAGMENVTSQYYVEDAGYPMPAATAYGGLQLRY